MTALRLLWLVPITLAWAVGAVVYWGFWLCRGLR
jgi:hypothetical protein